MTRIVAACLAALAAALMVSSRSVETYYDDTHYSFTYYAARVCGYTPLQAHRLASANLSIDASDSPLTEPVQEYGISNAAQHPRVAFHAFRDSRVPGFDKGKADLAIVEQRKQLWGLALSTKNPGVLLHFIQDELAHRGYASFAGHWASPGAVADRAAPVIAGPAGAVPGAVGQAARDITRGAIDAVSLAETYLPNGGTPDWISYRTDNNDRMVAMTLQESLRFMREMSPDQRPEPCDASQLRDVMLRLLQANPTPPTRDQYLAAVGQPERGVPDVAPAHAIVAQALAKERLDLRPYPRERIHYSFDGDGRPFNAGNPVGALGAFTLYGSVQVRLQRAAAVAPKPVAVSVWAAPTRVTEVPYQLKCEMATPAPFQEGPIVPNVRPFENLPVGDLIIQTVSSDGTITKQEVALDRLEQPVVVNLPAESEQLKDCGKEAARTAAKLCAAKAPAGSFRGSVPSIENMEAGLLRELVVAEGCRASKLTRNTPTQPPAPVPDPAPRQGGGGGVGRAVVGAAGAAAAAVGVAVMLEELKTTTTTTTTSVRTTTTTSTSTTTTSAAQALRCSTQNCIVSALSGNCDCNGFSNVACPVSDPARIQRSVNGACWNNGLYCDVNLSCNNNRCERAPSQGGRCNLR